MDTEGFLIQDRGSDLNLSWDNNLHAAADGETQSPGWRASNVYEKKAKPRWLDSTKTNQLVGAAGEMDEY